MKDKPSKRPTAKPATARSTSSPGHTIFKYRPQFGLVVVCTDESTQRSTYDRLLKMGLTVKVVVV